MIDFKQACDYVMPIGKYRGQTLRDIAGDDEGLLWLDWLRGRRGIDPAIKQHIDAYLDDPTIERELLVALGDG